jgi:hypothetical protein
MVINRTSASQREHRDGKQTADGPQGSDALPLIALDSINVDNTSYPRYNGLSNHPRENVGGSQAMAGDREQRSVPDATEIVIVLAGSGCGQWETPIILVKYAYLL